MNQNLLVFAIILLVATAANSIPLVNKLEKRVTTYMQCPLKPSPPPTLSVYTIPDPLVAGGTATFYMEGSFARPATQGSAIVFAFFDQYDNLLENPPYAIDICSSTNIYCPISRIYGYSYVPVPYNLPKVYSVYVIVIDPTGKYALSCAGAVVGGSSGYLTFNSTSSLTYNFTDNATFILKDP